MDNTASIHFRPATRRDAASIWGVRTRAIEAIPRSFYDAQKIARWAKTGMPDAFERVIVELDAVVAELDRQMIGWGLLAQNVSRIEAVFVDPDFQRRGITSRILATLEDLARSAGLRSLTLSSTLNAVPFYESAGFERRGRTKYCHPDGFELGCIVMFKELDTEARPD